MARGFERHHLRALAAAALVLAPIAFAFRQIAAGGTFAETWEYAFDPLFASAREFRAEPQEWWGSKESTPAVLMATSDRFCARSYRRLELPLWNPHQALGTPLAAELNIPVFAPLRVLSVYLPGGSDLASSAGSILYFVVGALSVVLWLRSAGLSLAAAAPAAFAYVFNGQAIAAFRFPNFPAVTLMPLVLWRIERLFRERTALGALYLGVTGALVVISSHATSAYVVFMGSAIYFATRITGAAATEGWRAGGQLALAGGLAAAEAAALSAFAWVPFLEFLRNGFSYKFGPFAVNPPLGLSVLLFPKPDVPWGLAAPALIWGLAGAFVASPIRLGACAMAAFALGHVWGPPVLGWMVRHLPGMSAVQPQYAFFVGALASCALMAGAIDAASRAERGARAGAACATAVLVAIAVWLPFRTPGPPSDEELGAWRVLAAAGAVAALWAGASAAARLRGTVIRRRWGLALSVYTLCALELLPRVEREIAPEPRFDFPETGALRFLHEKAVRGERIVGVSPRGYFWPGSSPHLPNAGLATGLDDPRSVQAVFVRRAYRLLRLMNGGADHPTVLEFYRYPDLLGRGSAAEGPPTGLEMLGVRYLLGSPGKEPPPGHRRVYADRTITIDENPRAFARAFLVHDALRARGEDDAERKIRTIDFSRQAVIEGDAPPLPDAARENVPKSGLENGEKQAETVVLETLAARTVSVRAVVARPAFLVLTDAYFPGWRATVDGEPATIFPANLALRAVYLEPGEHLVEFRYAPGSFRTGLAICGAGLLALIGCVVVRPSMRSPRCRFSRAFPRPGRIFSRAFPRPTAGSSAPRSPSPSRPPSRWPPCGSGCAIPFRVARSPPGSSCPRYGATGGVVDAIRRRSGRIPLCGSYLLLIGVVEAHRMREEQPRVARHRPGDPALVALLDLEPVLAVEDRAMGESLGGRGEHDTHRPQRQAEVDRPGGERAPPPRGRGGGNRRIRRPATGGSRPVGVTGRARRGRGAARRRDRAWRPARA